MSPTEADRRRATDLEFALRDFVVQVGDDELRTRALFASRADGGATSLTSRVGRFLRLAEPVVLPAATLGALSKVEVWVSTVPCVQMTDIRRTRCLLTTESPDLVTQSRRARGESGRSSLVRGIQLNQDRRLTAYGLALDSPPPLTRLLRCPPVFSLRTAPRVRSSSEAMLCCADYG